MNTPLRVGVVGSNIGQAHIRGYQSLPNQFEVTALCDINQPLGQEIAAQFGIPKVYTQFAALCSDDSLDIIDICTPSHLHYTQALQAVRSGKHVVVEKPAGASLMQIDALIEAEILSDRYIMPIYQYRFGNGLQKLKFLKELGLTGDAYLTTIETSWRRRSDYYAIPWRGRWATELGGPLVTLAIHAHDMLYYILGPARRVFARYATRVNPIETEDCISASLEMANGSLCSLSVTTGSAKEISRLRFCFSNLSAESNNKPYQPSTDPWEFTPDTPEIEQQITEAFKDFIPTTEGYTEQFSRFARAVRLGEELPVTLKDARASIELITAIYHSAQTGEQVELPIDKQHLKYTGWCP